MDDWLIIPAEVILIIMSVLTLIGVHGHAYGYKIPEETQEDALNADPATEILNDKMSYGIFSIQCIQITFAKLSILFFYRRIFCSTKIWDSMNIAIWILVGFTITWGISFFFANIFECGTDFAANWDATAAITAKCIKLTEMNEAWFISDFVIDFIIFVMPMYKIWKLHMDILRKLAVIAILALGAVSIVASAIKVAIIVQLEGIVRSGFSPSDTLIPKDPNILQSIIIYWTVLESGIAVIVACLPTLRALVNQSPDLLRSLRSMLSVNSLRSSVGRSQNNVRNGDIQSISSQAQINTLDNLEAGMGNNAYAMKDLDERGRFKNVITVESHVTQESAERIP